MIGFSVLGDAGATYTKQQIATALLTSAPGSIVILHMNHPESGTAKGGAGPSLRGHYDDRFKRMWEYYLLSSAGAFRARNLQVWQIVMTRQGSGRAQPACRL